MRIMDISLPIDGNDYNGLVGQQLQYTLNSTRNMINVTIINDSVFEVTESFSVSLALPGSIPPRVTLAPNSAQITILDDDGQFNDLILWYMHGIAY